MVILLPCAAAHLWMISPLPERGNFLGSHADAIRRLRILPLDIEEIDLLTAHIMRRLSAAYIGNRYERQVSSDQLFR